MKKMSIKEMLLTICVSYTIISASVHLFEMILGVGNASQHMQGLMMLFCTGVAVCILFLYYLLEDWPMPIVMLLQYIVATAIILGAVFVLSHFSEVGSSGYFDMWRSFTVIYLIGAAVYYIDIIWSIKKQNKWLQEAQTLKQKVNEGKYLD